MKHYFAYGSNLWRKQMKSRCPGHTLVGHGVLSGYRWIISKSGYATVVKSPADEVHGVVYELSEADESSLDDYECVSEGLYIKEMMFIDVAGQPMECLVYVEPVEEEGVPLGDYIQRMNNGLADAALPNDYVEKYVRKFIPR